MQINEYSHRGALINAHRNAAHDKQYTKRFKSYREALSHYLKVHYRAQRILKEQEKPEYIEQFYSRYAASLHAAKMTN